MPAVLNVHPALTPYTNQNSLIQYLNPTFDQSVIQDAAISDLAIQLYQVDTKEQFDPSLCLNVNQNKIKGNNHLSSYPIVYQRKKIGSLHLIGSALDTEHKIQEQKHFQGLTKKLALLIKRYQATNLSHKYLGKDLSLTGYSEPILALDSFIEKAASTYCPVIIEGAFGSEKLCVASAIHYNSQIKHKPFIEINCSTPSTEEFQQNLILCFKQAQGGCVFLHDIDELSLSQQNLLTELLSASTSPGVSGHKLESVTNVRLLVSTTSSLAGLTEKKLFARGLYQYFNFLHVQIPALSKRKEDIPYILEKLIKKYCLFPEQEFSEEVNQAFCNYQWPDNYSELERVVTRLLTLSTSNPINLADLKLHTPEILAKHLKKKGNAEFSCEVLDLTNSLINKDYQKFTRLHVGLQKALHYLAENYTESMSLTTLAQNAFISPSHLSYLFKFYLQKPFKQVLSELKIERAKQIFATNPHIRITDVSLDVGFGDLSHFEKMFKRYTKMTPREYKNTF